jgi:hypothetical protein
MHDDGVHDRLAHEVTKLCELRTIEGHPGVVIGKDMGVWHGIAFLPRQGLTGRKLSRE